jgi:hypothetical protein
MKACMIELEDDVMKVDTGISKVDNVIMKDVDTGISKVDTGISKVDNVVMKDVDTGISKVDNDFDDFIECALNVSLRYLAERSHFLKHGINLLMDIAVYPRYKNKLGLHVMYLIECILDTWSRVNYDISYNLDWETVIAMYTLARLLIDVPEYIALVRESLKDEKRIFLMFMLAHYADLKTARDAFISNSFVCDYGNINFDPVAMQSLRVCQLCDSLIKLLI